MQISACLGSENKFSIRLGLSFHITLRVFLCFFLHTRYLVGPNTRFRAPTPSSGIRATLLSKVDEEQKRQRRGSLQLKEKDQVSKSHFQKNMASTSGTGVEIRKFDGKNFALWKEMMHDVLIIKKQVEAIRHSEKPASMTLRSGNQ